MKKHPFIAAFAALLAALALSSCATLGQKHLYSASLRNSYSNAFLWQQVQKNPTVYHPKELPQGYKIHEKSGEWVVDKKTQTSFFVPYRECAGISPAGWRNEAQKAVQHLYEPDPPQRKDDFKDETSAQYKAERVGLAILAYPFERLVDSMFDDIFDDDDDDEFSDPFYQRKPRGRGKGKDDKKDECPRADDTPDDDKDDCPEPSKTGSR